MSRSKPFAVLLPPPSGSPSVPGMLTPPSISAAGDTYTVTAGTYAGEVSRTVAYELDGADVSGRVTGGSLTAGAGDAGKLFAFRETVAGVGGETIRQASVVIA